MRLELISRVPNEASDRILFVHGAYHAAWCWEEHFLDYFAQSGYSAYALSLRGHGNSEGSSQKVGFNDYLEDLNRTIQKLGQQTILVGHSLGGMLVQKYIETNPVPAAVILSTATPQGLLKSGKRLLRLYPVKTLQMLLTGDPDRLWHSSQVIEQCFLPNDIVPAKKSQYIQQILSEFESGRLMLRELVSLEFHRPMHPQRVLVMKGKQDPLVQDQECEAIAKLHQVKPIFLDHLSHDLMLGENWQIAAATILQWLQSEI